MQSAKSRLALGQKKNQGLQQSPVQPVGLQFLRKRVLVNLDRPAAGWCIGLAGFNIFLDRTANLPSDCYLSWMVLLAGQDLGPRVLGRQPRPQVKGATLWDTIWPQQNLLPKLSFKSFQSNCSHVALLHASSGRRVSLRQRRQHAERQSPSAKEEPLRLKSKQPAAEDKKQASSQISLAAVCCRPAQGTVRPSEENSQMNNSSWRSRSLSLHRLRDSCCRTPAPVPLRMIFDGLRCHSGRLLPARCAIAPRSRHLCGLLFLWYHHVSTSCCVVSMLAAWPIMDTAWSPRAAVRDCDYPTLHFGIAVPFRCIVTAVWAVSRLPAQN